MKKAIVLFAIATAFLVSCLNAEKKESSLEETSETVDAGLIDSHNSKNSLDWSGVYEGTTPCADCEGIKTVLELKKDNTYVLSQTYLGKPKGENEFNKSGSFVWDEASSKVLLKSDDYTLQYKVGENQLWMLDSSGSVITSDLSELYILKKTLQ